MLFAGIVMIVTPGPAVIFIPLGLTILGAEFAWARGWLKRLRQRGSSIVKRKVELLPPAKKAVP